MGGGLVLQVSSTYYPFPCNISSDPFMYAISRQNASQVHETHFLNVHSRAPRYPVTINLKQDSQDFQRVECWARDLILIIVLQKQVLDAWLDSFDFQYRFKYGGLSNMKLSDVARAFARVSEVPRSFWVFAKRKSMPSHFQFT